MNKKNRIILPTDRGELERTQPNSAGDSLPEFDFHRTPPVKETFSVC